MLYVFRNIFRNISFLLALLALFTALPPASLAASAQASQPLRVTFISPSYPGSVFWDTVTSFMQAAADDLNIDLKVLHASTDANIDQLRFTELILREAASPNKPDYLLTMFRKNSSKKVLEAIEQGGLKTFIFNTAAPAELRTELGKPRERYKSWIGHMYPDDLLAGYDLANTLVAQAREKGMGTDGNGDAPSTIQIIGLSGNMHSVAALDRNHGLAQATQARNTILHQIVFARWQRPLACNMTRWLLHRYPQTNVLWAASDSIALGGVDGVQLEGKTPGRDILIGGVDWFPEAIDAVRRGDMAVTAGGHFMEGGWALVMLYDYHHGKDFADTVGVEIRSRLKHIHAGNVEDYARHFGAADWKKIDFTKYSRVLSPDQKGYDFSLDNMFKQMEVVN